MRRHEVVHTGMRNFLCQFCPERFGRKDHLIRHIKKLHYQQQQQQTTLDQQQSLAATTTPTSSSTSSLIKLEDLDIPVLPATDAYYGTRMDFLFSAAAVADVDHRRSSVYDDNNEGEEGISERVGDFKLEPPLEDLGSNVLEDIAEADGSSSQESVAASTVDIASPVDDDLVQLLQQTGKLPAFDQIFQQSVQQQQQQQPPNS